MQLFFTLSFLLAASTFACSPKKFKSDANNIPATKSAVTSDSNTLSKGPSSTTPNSGDGIAGQPSPFQSPATVAALKAKCLGAAAGTKKTASQTLTYPERNGCSFGVAPNLGRKQGVNTASEVSTNALQLPAGEICEISIQSPPGATLRYDDFLALSIDSRAIFISNTTLLKNLDLEQGIYTWDFKKIIGKRIEQFATGSYCLGTAGNCIIPGTEQEGKVALNLTANEIAPIAAAISGKKSVPMDLTATGDDNDSDCSHTALTVTVQFQYLAP